MSNTVDKIEWTISVPVFRNSIILKQLGIAIGIPFGIVIIILIIAKAMYALILIAALFLFTYLLIRIMWRGKYDVGFELDKTGIRSYTLPKQAKQNRVLNILTVVLGFLSGKPAVAGAGILAQSRQQVFIRWKNIRKVKYLTGKNTIMLRAGFTENIAVFCTIDNYAVVEAYIRSNIPAEQIVKRRNPSL